MEEKENPGREGTENTRPVLWMIIPCYNEEEVLPRTAPLFLDKILELEKDGLISRESRILLVNDGSSDGTWPVIEELAEKDRHFLGIEQSRNRGHQNALLAGLMEARDRCDIAVSMDCDGQDDIGALRQMITAYMAGSEIVYGVRAHRTKDSFFKRNSAQAYYRLLNLMGVEAVYNHADYRLVSARVLKELEKYGEVNLFLRGIFPLIGFQSTCVYYDRKERAAGRSHYSLGRMLGLAFDGITSMSIRPIRVIMAMGFFVAVFSFIGVLWSVARYFAGATVSGWASMTAIICFLGGVQMISLGVIGEYVGKTYLETKRRPRYIISRRTRERAESGEKGEGRTALEPQGEEGRDDNVKA